MRGLKNSRLFTHTAGVVAIILLVFASCSQPKNPKRFAEYMKAEKELHARVTPEQGLQDSTKALGKRFGLDPENEIAKMKNDPDAWKRLLETLAGKK